MNFLYSDEPIIACSTSNVTNAAMSVLRISGFKDLSSFQDFFSIKLAPIEPRRVYYTKLIYKGELVDDICLTYFQGPRSYNGENILELSIHGNMLNVERVINIFTKDGGCRVARPGEFTYRALKNKKLNLSQVEGLDLFLNANSGYALNQGLSLLAGTLHEAYGELYDLFLKHKSALELSIDFIDDVGEETAQSYFISTLKALQSKFETLSRRVGPMDLNIVQPEIVLAGLPNSGKSSLFNALLADERAIVSSIPGTTRDYISEAIMIEGVKYLLVDTAGIRMAEDVVEGEGIKRSKKKISKSFFSILLINPLEIVDGFDELVSQDFDVILFTHSDLPGFEEAKNKLISIYPLLGSIGAINLLDEKKGWENHIFSAVNEKYLDSTSKNPILLDRHKSLIIEGREMLEVYVNSAGCETDIAILSSELNTLGHCISELIGIISPDQILDSIFSNFCIGK